MRIGLAWLAALALAAAALAQAPPPQPPPKPAEQEKPKPARKARKVWTDDDLKGLRKPWEEHAERRQAAEEAAKPTEAKPAEAKSAGEANPDVPIDPKTGKPYEQPGSLAYLERQLRGWEEELRRTEALAEEARREVGTATDHERLESAKLKLDVYEQNVVDMQGKIADLRARLAEARKQKGSAPPAASRPQS